MSHSTLDEIGYRFPQLCCGNCNNSFKNMYGDAHCKLLAYTDIIDLGGICDLHTSGSTNSVDTDIVSEPDAVDTYEETGSCVTCKHSAHVGGIPMCDVDNQVIADANNRCAAYEEE